MKVSILTIASAAAIGTLLISTLSTPLKRAPPPVSSLSSAASLDPKTVQLRSAEEGAPGPAAAATFPFRYVTEKSRNCVQAQHIINTSQFIQDLYLKHNIRFFPRNGFLLGIVRHGGFLPNEKVDADMAVVYEDLLRLDGQGGLKINGESTKGNVGDFDIKLNPTQNSWVNWKGIVPGTQERYPFHRVVISRRSFAMTAYAVYPYHDTAGYFYPRANMAGVNHATQTKDSLRYNEQGGDYRLVDTDERISPSNVSSTLLELGGDLCHSAFVCNLNQDQDWQDDTNMNRLQNLSQKHISLLFLHHTINFSSKWETKLK